MKLYLKYFNNQKELYKELKKQLKKIGRIKDKKIDCKEIEGITVKYYCYCYYREDKKDYKDLSILTLTDGTDYFLVYVNKWVNPNTLLYNLYKINYIKTLNFETEFYASKNDKILSYKISEVDFYLGNNTDIIKNFKGLKNLLTLKQMCIDEYEKINNKLGLQFA